MTRRRAASSGEPDHPSDRGAPPRETNGQESSVRQLPSVDALIRAGQAQLDGMVPPVHARLVASARAVIAEERERRRAGEQGASFTELVDRLSERLRAEQTPSLRPVINATGVIVNTNLGRAPLASQAIVAMSEVGRGYSNLEYDLAAGERGARHIHVRELLRALTGAEDALAVNNNAAAVLVVLSALAAGREVIVSRGELVEIGGGFRVPDVMRQGGARLVEVGTTNRTRASDYAAAITAETAAILVVHPSNFRVVGFTETPALADLASLAHARGLPLVHDLGSGCLTDTLPFGLAHEPTPAESMRAGADVVCFSGDKLLGGPQAGLIIGRSVFLSLISRHPLMRALRIDKLTLAALEATLRVYLDGKALTAIPIWRAISQPLDALRARADQWIAFLAERSVAAHAEAGESAIGGGSLPGETLPTTLCVIHGGGRDMQEVAQRLRVGEPPVVCRLYRDDLYLDPRTVLPEDDASLLAALARGLGVAQ